MDFLKGARDFARNPLGIIALFISLIYGFASLLLDSSAEKLTVLERWPLIIFIVIFPILVLVTFYKLVTKHHGKLYAPGDFKDDKSFLRTLSPEEQEKKLEEEVSESLGEISADGLAENDVGRATNSIDGKDKSSETNIPLPGAEKGIEEHRRFREELRDIEKAVISMVASEYKTNADVNVGIGGTDVQFDAFLQMLSGKATFLEVKALRRPSPAFGILDRVLYNAVVADNFFKSDFKLILAVVYYFDESELERVKRYWDRKIEKCPASIELRFIPRSNVVHA